MVVDGILLLFVELEVVMGNKMEEEITDEEFDEWWMSRSRIEIKEEVKWNVKFATNEIKSLKKMIEEHPENPGNRSIQREIEKFEKYIEEQKRRLDKYYKVSRPSELLTDGAIEYYKIVYKEQILEWREKK